MEIRRLHDSNIRSLDAPCPICNHREVIQAWGKAGIRSSSYRCANCHAQVVARPTPKAFLAIPVALLVPVLYWATHVACAQLGLPTTLRAALLGAVAGAGIVLVVKVAANGTTLRPKS